MLHLLVLLYSFLFSVKFLEDQLLDHLGSWIWWEFKSIKPTWDLINRCFLNQGFSSKTVSNSEKITLFKSLKHVNVLLSCNGWFIFQFYTPNIIFTLVPSTDTDKQTCVNGFYSWFHSLLGVYMELTKCSINRTLQERTVRHITFT